MDRVDYSTSNYADSFDRAEDRRRYHSPCRLFHQHVLCRGLCPGFRECGIVRGGCSGRVAYLSFVFYLVSPAGRGRVIEVGLMLRRERIPKSTYQSIFKLLTQFT